MPLAAIISAHGGEFIERTLCVALLAIDDAACMSIWIEGNGSQLLLIFIYLHIYKCNLEYRSEEIIII